MNFIENVKCQIEKIQEQLKNNIYLLEDENIRKDTKRYSEILFTTGILKGKKEGLEIAISLYKKTS